MRRLASLPLYLGILLSSRSVFASPVRTVYSSQAQGINSSIIQLKVGPGYGMNINLPKGETVTKAVIDDKSRIGISSDGNLCPWTNQQTNQQQNCIEKQVAMLHLHQIKLINFPNMLHSPDGGTLLTVRVQGASGEKTYLFKVIPIPGLSEFVSLDIKLDDEKPIPLFPVIPRRQSSLQMHSTTPIVKQYDQAPDSNIQRSTVSSPLPDGLTHFQKRDSIPHSSGLSDHNKIATFSDSSDDANAAAFGLRVAPAKRSDQALFLLVEQGSGCYLSAAARRK